MQKEWCYSREDRKTKHLLKVCTKPSNTSRYMACKSSDPQPSQSWWGSLDWSSCCSYCHKLWAECSDKHPSKLLYHSDTRSRALGGCQSCCLPLSKTHSNRVILETARVILRSYQMVFTAPKSPSNQQHCCLGWCWVVLIYLLVLMWLGFWFAWQSNLRKYQVFLVILWILL